MNDPNRAAFSKRYVHLHNEYRSAYQNFATYATIIGCAPIMALPAGLLAGRLYQAIAAVLLFSSVPAWYYTRCLSLRKRLNTVKTALESMGLVIAVDSEDWRREIIIVPSEQLKATHSHIMVAHPINFRTYHRLFEIS